MSRVLVTGNCGFIGSHLTDRLIADAHEVTGLDDLSTGSRDNLNPAAQFKQAKLSWVDASFLYGFDAIFHCAAIARTPTALKFPSLTMQVNTMGTATLLAAAHEAGVKRFIYSSSNVVYAGPTAYRASKLAAEMMCDVYNEIYGMSAIALRYSNVYGSRLRKGDPAVFASLRDSARDRGYMEITGDGTQTRNFMHVQDCVEGNILAWRSDYKGIVDLCTDVNTTLNDAARLISPVEIRYIGERLGDVRHILQDPEPAANILGWRAKIALAEGIGDVWK